EGGGGALEAYDAFRASHAPLTRTVYQTVSQPASSFRAAPPSSKGEIGSLQAAFDALDVQCTGVLGFPDVQRALLSLGLHPSPHIAGLLAVADADRDGALRFSEFCDVVAKLRAQGGKLREPSPRNSSVEIAEVPACEREEKYTGAVEAKAAFDRHDKDYDGCISTRELRHALRDLNLQAPMQPDPSLLPSDTELSLVSTESALKLVDDLDLNSDGKIELTQFKAVVRQLRHLQGIAPAAAATSLRAAFSAFDLKGEGAIQASDVRTALERAGVEMAGGVALTICNRLGEQPMKAVDFSQFQRIAHAISSQRTPSAPLFTQLDDYPPKPSQAGSKASLHNPSTHTSSSYPPPSSLPSYSQPPRVLGSQVSSSPALPTRTSLCAPSSPPNGYTALMQASGALYDSTQNSANSNARRVARKPTTPTRNAAVLSLQHGSARQPLHPSA
ncbi:MAG: hypothetical protein SGPRY_006955, partial [Prymnesium sp.]